MLKNLTIKFNKDGLVPVITTDYKSNKVLMHAWMNLEALQETIDTMRACYFSRSRQRLWRKGEESGNYQEICDIVADCDVDTLLLKVKQKNQIACHTGRESCFYYKFDLEKNRHNKTMLNQFPVVET